jgi:L-fuconolactonase
MIVDTHVHVVTDDRSRYPQRDKPPAWPPTTGEMLLKMMDTAGIDKAVLVQTYFTYGYDNSYMTDIATARPDRFTSVCVLDPLDPKAPDELEMLVTKRGVRGIRLMNDRAHNVISLDDPKTFPLWERIATLGIPVTVAALIDDVARTAVPAAHFPGVKIAVDHIWGLKVGDGPAFDPIRPVLDLARHPNVYVKIAANNSFAVRQGNGTTRDFYGLIVKTFGANRVMWGSNYPAHAQAYGSLDERTKLAQADLSFLSEEDRGCLLSGTALTLWPELRNS